MIRFLFLIIMILLASRANAQTITVVHNLSFGRFATLNNNTAHTIVVQTNNTTSYDPDIISDTDAQRGEYLFNDLPANVQFHVGVSTSTPPSDGGLILDNATPVSLGGQSFTLGSLTATDLITDASGDGTMYVGGTLTTSGSGVNYNSGHYTGSFDITLYY